MELDTNKIDFKKLVSAIQRVHNQLSDQACHAVNTSLTLRNWLMGLYIREYEQHGTDRAQYGESLLDRLSEVLRRIGIPRSDTRELRRYRLFYSVYPQIREALTPESGILLCTDKNHTLVEYALAGMDNNLFVSKYLLELPKKEEMQRFIEEQVRETVDEHNISKTFSKLKRHL